MIRTITVFLGVLVATGANAAEWSGVPAEVAASLGLGQVTVVEVGDAWRAPVPGGGFVMVETYDDEAGAHEAFRFRATSATNITPPPLDLADEAVGDGDAYVLLRDGNVLVRVRALAGGATAIAERIRGALVAR